MPKKRVEKRNKLKRRRMHPSHRWTSEETRLLLKHVMDAVMDKPEEFEQPTAMQFYKKISMKTKALHGLRMQVFRGKMRHLKLTYINAAWKLRNATTQVKAQAIKNGCPHWEMLDKIFAPMKTKKAVDQPNNEILLNHFGNIDSVAPLRNELLWNPFRTDGSNKNGAPVTPLRNEGSENEEDNSDDIGSYEETHDNNAANKKKLNKTPPLINTVTPAKRRGPVPKSAQVVAQMVARHDNKLKLEEHKWRKQQALNIRNLEFEQELFQMRVIELQQQLEKKRELIVENERIFLEKMEQEVEMMERVKMYELVTKQNNQVEI